MDVLPGQPLNILVSKFFNCKLQISENMKIAYTVTPSSVTRVFDTIDWNTTPTETPDTDVSFIASDVSASREKTNIILVPMMSQLFIVNLLKVENRKSYGTNYFKRSNPIKKLTTSEMKPCSLTDTPRIRTTAFEWHRLCSHVGRSPWPKYSSKIPDQTPTWIIRAGHTAIYRAGPKTGSSKMWKRQDAGRKVTKPAQTEWAALTVFELK